MSDTDLDALLLHRDFVRDLARSLLGDPHLAADAEQDTWVAAIRGGPDDPGSARAWLGAVVRNFAYRQTRGTGRRRARELAVAAREATASTGDLVERERVRRKVVAAVLELEEPFRSAVVFRYFEDLPPRKIATRTGVSVNTVRSRLRLAHEKLRTLLDDEHGGSRALWAAPLLGLVGRSTGVLLMTAKTKALLAVAVVLLLAGAVWWQGSGPGRAPEPAGGGSPPSALADGDPSSSGMQAPGVGTAGDLASKTGRIEGKIPFGAEDLAVRIMLVSTDGERVQRTPDANGKFSFDDLPAGETFLVRAEAAGYAPSISPGLLIRAGETTSTRLPEFRLPVSLVVTVKSLSGQPLSGAAVAAIHHRHRGGQWALPTPPASFRSLTGADGGTGFEELGDGLWLLEVRKEGFAREVQAVHLYPHDGRHEQEIRLAPGYRLTGRVVDESGGPVARAVILAGPSSIYTETDPYLAGTSTLRIGGDSQGEFCFTDLPEGLFDVMASLEGGGESGRVHVRIPGPDRLELVIRSTPSGTVEGTVTDADSGVPVPGATVTIDRKWVKTDEAGRYRHERVAPGTHTPGVGAAGYRAIPAEEVTVAAGQVVTADLEVSRGSTVLGRVTSSDGPVVGAQVFISPVGLPKHRRYQDGRTDGEGHYSISGLEAGRYHISAHAPGHYLSGDATSRFDLASADERHFVEIESTGEVKHDIYLGQTVDLSGQVVDERGKGLPAVSLKVYRWPPGLPGHRTITDGSGGFTLPGIHPERGSELILSRRGYRTRVARVHIEAPESGAPVVIEMLPLARVVGFVRSAHGSPLPGAQVQIRAHTGPQGSQQVGGTSPPTHTTCDDRGRYEALAPAVAGYFSVHAITPGYGPAASTRVRIEAGIPEYEVSLVLEPTHSISGRVVAAGSGEGVFGARVKAGAGGGGGRLDGPICAVTDREGRFEVFGLREGSTQIGAVADGFAVTKPLVVTAPVVGEVRIVLSPALSIEGTVVFEDGSPVEGAAVSAVAIGAHPLPFAAPMHAGYTGADGSFRIDGLLPGDYHLKITSNLIPQKTVQNVTAGSPPLRIIADRGGEIAGRIVDSAGKGIPGCAVHARPLKQITDISQFRYTEADDDGRFRLTGLEMDSYTISVSPPIIGMFPAYVLVDRADVSPGTTDLRLILERTQRMAGRVRDEAGQPVSEGFINIELVGDKPGGVGIGLSADGSFSAGGLEKGMYRLSHRTKDASRDLVLTGDAEVPAGTTDLELIAVPGKALTGRVEDGDGQPVAGAWVSVMPPGKRDERNTTSNADGTFRIQGLEPDTEWRLYARTSDGRRRGRIDYLVSGTDDIRVIVR